MHFPRVVLSGSAPTDLRFAGAIEPEHAELDHLDFGDNIPYPTLTTDEVEALVVDHKWMVTLGNATHGELGYVSQALTQRVKELAERYGQTMSQLMHFVKQMDTQINEHLAKMGFV